MSAMQRWGHGHPPHDRLESARQIEVPVLEQVGRSEDQLEHEHALGRYTEEYDGCKTHGEGEEQLARVEAELT